MGSKGTILIVEDLLEEKVGVFKQILDIEGFKTVVSENYKDAKEMLEKLIASNKLNGIILDFSFPVDENDKSVVINDIPCGVVLLKENLFKLTLQNIPVVINTTGEEEYKKKHLSSLGTITIPTYDINNTLTNLARPSVEMTKEIIKMFNECYERKKLEASIKSDNSLRTGKAVIQGENGDYYYSRYDGD